MPSESVRDQHANPLVSLNGNHSAARRMIHANGITCDSSLKVIGVLAQVMQQARQAREVLTHENVGAIRCKSPNIRQVLRERLPI
jgi:hypothetical protein